MFEHLPLVTDVKMTLNGSFTVEDGWSGPGSRNMDFADGYFWRTGNKIWLSKTAQNSRLIAQYKIPSSIKKISSIKDGITVLKLEQPIYHLDVDPRIPVGPENFFRICGLYERDNVLYFNHVKWYGDGTQFTTGFIDNASDLKSGVVQSNLALDGGYHYSGVYSDIPDEYSEQLGGDVVTYQTNQSFVGRFRMGPSMIIFEPKEFKELPDSQNIVRVSGWSPMDYPYTPKTVYRKPGEEIKEGQTIEEFLCNTSWWTILSKVAGGSIVPGTRTWMIIADMEGSTGLPFRTGAKNLPLKIERNKVGYKNHPWRYNGSKNDYARLQKSTDGYTAEIEDDSFGVILLFDMAEFGKKKPHEIREYKRIEFRNPVRGTVGDYRAAKPQCAQLLDDQLIVSYMEKASTNGINKLPLFNIYDMEFITGEPQEVDEIEQLKAGLAAYKAELERAIEKNKGLTDEVQRLESLLKQINQLSEL